MNFLLQQLQGDDYDQDLSNNGWDDEAEDIDLSEEGDEGETTTEDGSSDRSYPVLRW